MEKVEFKSEKQGYLLFNDIRVAIVILEKLKDGSTFVVLEKPVLINKQYGPTAASSYYIVYKDGSFDVCPDKTFKNAMQESYVKSFRYFLSREVRQEIFIRDSYGEWPMVKIE
jgi:hypothetical protein